MLKCLYAKIVQLRAKKRKLTILVDHTYPIHHRRLFPKK